MIKKEFYLSQLFLMNIFFSYKEISFLILYLFLFIGIKFIKKINLHVFEGLYCFTNGILLAYLFYIGLHNINENIIITFSIVIITWFLFNIVFYLLYRFYKLFIKY